MPAMPPIISSARNDTASPGISSAFRSKRKSPLGEPCGRRLDFGADFFMRAYGSN